MTSPARYVALWRAVNVGRHQPLPMAELTEALLGLKLAGARTVLQTGNAVFDSTLTPAQLEPRLEVETARRWGITTPVMVRTSSEWTEIVRGNPFVEACRTEPSRVLLYCLKGPPAATAGEALTRVIGTPDLFHLAGRALYLVYPDGIGQSRLTPAAIDRALGTPATARNWNTVRKIETLLHA